MEFASYTDVSKKIKVPLLFENPKRREGLYTMGHAPGSTIHLGTSPRMKKIPLPAKRDSSRAVSFTKRGTSRE